MASITAWLRQIHGAQAGNGRRVRRDDHSLGALTLRELLQIHKDWRASLELDLGSGRLDLVNDRAVACAESCTVGMWLQGPGRERFGHLPAWLAACRAHTRYHQSASELVEAHRRSADQSTLISLGYRLRDASSQSQLELVRLFSGAPNSEALAVAE